MSSLWSPAPEEPMEEASADKKPLGSIEEDILVGLIPGLKLSVASLTPSVMFCIVEPVIWRGDAPRVARHSTHCDRVLSQQWSDL